MITEDYVSYEVAKLLKDKGFDEPCHCFYEYKKRLYNDMDKYFPNGMKNSDHDKEGNKGVSAPTHQMACKWLRKEHNLYVSPTYRCFCGSKKNDKPYYKWEDRVLILPSGNQVHPQIYGIHEYYETYKGAIEAALKFTLENLI